MIKRKQLQRVFFLTAVICTGYLTGQAQAIDKSILTNYPAAVVARVYDVASKINIDAAKQKLLADAFEEQDNIVVNLIKQKASSIAIDSIKQELQRRWYNILSAKQQYYYSTASRKENNQFKYPFSLFSLAIENRDSLKLSEALVDSIFLRIDTLKRTQDAFIKENPGKWFDSKPYQSENMNRFLSADQFSMLLTIKNTTKARSYAEKDWKEIETRGLDKNYNKDTVLKELTAFYIAKQSAFDQYEHDKLKQSSLVKYITSNKPKILNVLIHARRNPANNTLGENF